MTFLRMAVVVVGLFVVALVVATLVGARRQQRSLAAQLERLERLPAPERPLSLNELPPDLPEPVARYLRWSLSRVGALGIVRLTQVGTLRTDAHSDRWMPFDAEHVVNPAGVGFVWNARIRIVPLVHLQVRDAYLEGEGRGQVALFSAFPVSSAAGTPEMNSGSLHRFLAEAVWYPTALLPTAALRWEPIDDGRALATLTDRGTSVSLEFRFAESGEVTAIYTPGRWGTFEGGYEQRPWEGHFRGYVERDGLRVPTEGDVGWYVDGAWHAVWIGTVSELVVEPVEGPAAR